MMIGEKPLPTPVDGSNRFDQPDLFFTIQTLFKELSVRTRKVLLSIPGHGVLFKRIEMPSFSKASVDQQTTAIESEIQSHIAVPADRAAYDWTVMHQTGKTTHLLMAWMRREVLESLVSQLKAMGIKVVFAMPQPLVLANQLRVSEAGSERICGIQRDGDRLDLIVIEGGQVMGGRSLDLGSMSNPTQFWRTLKQSLAGLPNPNKVDLKRVVLFQVTSSEPLRFTSEQIHQQLGVHTSEITEPVDDWAPTILRCHLHNEGVSLNLLQPILRERILEKKRRQKQQVRHLIPVVAAIGLFSANFGIFHKVESAQKRVDNLTKTSDDAKEIEMETQKLQKRLVLIDKHIATLSWGEHHFPSLAKRLEFIAVSIPQSVRLTEIKTLEPPRSGQERVSFDARAALLLRGLARSQEEIDAFRVALVTREEFIDVRQIQTEPTTIQKEKWLAFTLSLTSQADTTNEER